MDTNDSEQLNPDLVAQLQAMVRQAVAPSQILAFLKPQVEDKHVFTAYMAAACLDNECDEGTIWLVAARWWTNNQTPYGADRLLGPIFEQSRGRWLQREHARDQTTVHDE